jgi:hypothetical protein
MKIVSSFSLDRVEKTATLIGIFYSLVVFGSRVLTNNEAVAESSLVFYLVRQAWIEVIVLFGLIGVLLVYRRMHFRFAPSEQTSRFPVRVRVFLAFFQWILILFLSYCAVFSMYQFIRARHFFWTKASTRSFVEVYRERIDSLGRNGRIEDADDLINMVRNVLGRSATTAILEGRRRRIELAIKRSHILVESTEPTAGTWNPISQRSAYFKLVEAIRVDPQNLQAAERLRRYLTGLKPLLLRDIDSICSQKGDRHTMKLLATSLDDASLIWGNASQGRRPCNTYLQDLRSSWSVSDVECLLQISDAARAPSDDERSLTSTVPCLQAAIKADSDGSGPEEAEYTKLAAKPEKSTFGKVRELTLEMLEPIASFAPTRFHSRENQ